MNLGKYRREPSETD